ncbi:MAG: glutamate--cysteine ligase, partial [Gammaproteobacteria bacterium]|nr:glutamate--cysteine ligase [Gammaproteobacteria bacterium]
RRGLSYRYGRLMQIISGVHFNYSLPDRFWTPFQEFSGDGRARRHFVSDSYFAMIRNFQRLGWIIPYLFGSSPAVCKSFVKSRHGELKEFDSGTLYRPYATSLRMSDIGYKNQNQSDLCISYDNLDSYVSDLSRVIRTPHPDYEKIGVRVDGDYRQLNANVLQIENEYYSFIRPKQIARSGERPTLALKRRGVRYVEVRALDVSPYDPLGVNEEQLRFLELFLIFCLLLESPPVGKRELKDILHNQQLVACCGRDPDLKLRVDGESRSVIALAQQICAALDGLCELLDGTSGTGPYRAALSRQRELAAEPDALPSARILEELRTNNESYYEFAMRVSQAHRDYFQSRPLNDEKEAMFVEEAIRSIELQSSIEASDDISFDEYLERYFSYETANRERILG